MVAASYGITFSISSFRIAPKKVLRNVFSLYAHAKGSKGRELVLNCRAISRLCKTPRNKGNTPLLSLCDKFGVPKLIFAEENTVFGRTLAVSLFLVAKNKGNTPLLSLCDKLGVPKLIFAVENTIFGQTLAGSFVFSFIIAPTTPPPSPLSFI